MRSVLRSSRRRGRRSSGVATLASPRHQFDQEGAMHCEECGNTFELSEDCRWVAGDNTIIACPKCHATGSKSITPACEVIPGTDWLEKLWKMEDNR